MNKFKAVFHLDALSKVGGVLSNINNIITEIGVENMEIKVATTGDAVKAFVRNTSEFGPLIKDLADKHIEFSACANALQSFGIQIHELLDFVTIDSSDGIEILQKKAAGWSYFCP